MELDEDRAKEIKEALVAHRESDYPPRAVIEAVAHMIGSDPISSALGARDKAGRWRCIVMTSASVTLVEAARDGDTLYSLDSHYQEPTEVSAKMWGRRGMRRIELVQTREFGTPWNSEATYEVVFADGDRLAVPPDGAYIATGGEEALERVLTDLRASL